MILLLVKDLKPPSAPGCECLDPYQNQTGGDTVKLDILVRFHSHPDRASSNSECNSVCHALPYCAIQNKRGVSSFPGPRRA
jgi:hypothetical protein